MSYILMKILNTRLQEGNDVCDLFEHQDLDSYHFYSQEQVNLLFIKFLSSYDDISDIFKLCVIFLNQTTYYEKFIEKFYKNFKITFLLDTIMSNHKIQQLICFNSVNNLIEVKGYFFFKKIHEIIHKKIDILNKISSSSNYLKQNMNLELVVSLLEGSYQSNEIFPEELQNS